MPAPRAMRNRHGRCPLRAAPCTTPTGAGSPGGVRGGTAHRNPAIASVSRNARCVPRWLSFVSKLSSSECSPCHRPPSPMVIAGMPGDGRVCGHRWRGGLGQSARRASSPDGRNEGEGDAVRLSRLPWVSHDQSGNRQKSLSRHGIAWTKFQELVVAREV